MHYSPSAPSALTPVPRRSRGRPRKLDEAKRRQVCALIAAGGELSQAAQFVGCCTNTIRREAERHPEFRHQLSQARLFAPRHDHGDLPPGLARSIAYFERRRHHPNALERLGPATPDPADKQASDDAISALPNVPLPTGDALDEDQPAATLADLLRIFRKVARSRGAPAVDDAGVPLHPTPDREDS
jgi:hypothetical protein